MSILSLDNIKRGYFSFEGRLNRLPYFIRNVFVNLIFGVFVSSIEMFLYMHSFYENELTTGSFDYIALYSTNILSNATLTILFGLIIIISLISTWIVFSLNVRRCHDLNKSGWWLLLLFIPFVNFLFVLYLLFAKGTEGFNRFGANPLG